MTGLSAVEMLAFDAARVRAAFADTDRCTTRRWADRSWSALAGNLVAMVRADRPARIGSSFTPPSSRIRFARRGRGRALPVGRGVRGRLGLRDLGRRRRLQRHRRRAGAQQEREKQSRATLETVDFAHEHPNDTAVA